MECGSDDEEEDYGLRSSSSDILYSEKNKMKPLDSYKHIKNGSTIDCYKSFTIFGVLRDVLGHGNCFFTAH